MQEASAACQRARSASLAASRARHCRRSLPEIAVKGAQSNGAGFAAPRTMPGALTWRLIAAAAMVATLPFFSGCAVVAAAQAAILVTSLPSNEPHWVETNRFEFAYPVSDVYVQLTQGVERNGRKIVEKDETAHTLLVSYPFSLLQNNWGGTLKITCAATEYGSTVTIQGDGRDAVPRVRAIGDEVLEEVGSALRRGPRTL